MLGEIEKQTESVGNVSSVGPEGRAGKEAVSARPV
jgi:hypothetical protein